MKDHKLWLDDQTVFLNSDSKFVQGFDSSEQRNNFGRTNFDNFSRGRGDCAHLMFMEEL